MQQTSIRAGLGLLAGLLAFSLAACGGSGGSAAPTPTSGPMGDATHGQTVYTSSCSSCHGPDAKGIAGLGKDLTTSTFVSGLSDAELVDFVKTGRPTSDPLNTTGVDMPPKGGNPALSEQDLLDIVAYIRSLSQ